MKMSTRIAFALIVLVTVFAAYSLAKRPPPGANRFYEDQPYHFQTLRAFDVIPYGGADTGEILTTIEGIREGDDEGWYREWEELAVRVERAGREYKDSVSRGRALLRAHNYYRSAEFFLPPGDARRNDSFRKSVEVFHDALDALGVERELIQVPYGEHHLNAIYYPGPEGAESKPLIVAITGYDGTMEEIYFTVVAPALERGYSCLTYEGPGQGSVIREQGILFTHEWEKPNAAVLDEFLRNHPQPTEIVFVGISLGGYLAPRAAAFDKRIDGVVAFGVMYDVRETALMQSPKIMRSLYEKGFTRTVDMAMRLKMKTDPGVRWGIQNAMLTMGATGPVDVLDKFAEFSLKDICDKITCDVLILDAENDHVVPTEHGALFESKLVNARSVTMRIFTEEEGGQEHCQLGATTLVNAVLFDWIEDKFGDAET